MQSAETVLEVLRERGRRGLPLEGLYRQLFNRQLYLLAYGRIYSNKGAMTSGADAETADGMSMGKIERIIDALRHERYRFTPVKRVYIPKKDGKQRPLGLPSWSDKLVGEVVRLLLEAYYEPQFSNHSHGYRPGRGCHTVLRDVTVAWTGTTWFIEGDIDQCLSDTKTSRRPTAFTAMCFSGASVARSGAAASWRCANQPRTLNGSDSGTRPGARESAELSLSTTDSSRDASVQHHAEASIETARSVVGGMEVGSGSLPTRMLLSVLVVAVARSQRPGSQLGSAGPARDASLRRRLRVWRRKQALKRQEKADGSA